jgi:two-component system chemotaxis sensor kinase CheA
MTLNHLSTGSEATPPADIRISRTSLDALLRILTDLMDNQQQLRQEAGEDSRLKRVLDRQENHIHLLKDVTLSMRSTNLVKLFRQMKALAGELARKYGKEVSIRLEGAETQIDLTMLEALEGPLAHLVRNAIEHGLEDAETRKRLGKPPKGELTLSAFREGRLVCLRVCDDGTGLEDARVDTLKSSFKGLTQVEQSLRSLGGSFSLQPNLPCGTVAALNVPLAFQFVDGVAFDTMGQSIIIELKRIQEVVLPSAEDMRIQDGTGRLQLRDRIVPFLNAATIFGDGQSCPLREDQDSVPRVAVIVKNGQGDMALGVDGLRGVFRGPVLPLPSLWGRSRCLSGCMLLPNGHVGLMLCPEAIH